MAVSLKWLCLNAVVVEAAGSVTSEKSDGLGQVGHTCSPSPWEAEKGGVRLKLAQAAS